MKKIFVLSAVVALLAISLVLALRNADIPYETAEEPYIEQPVAIIYEETIEPAHFYATFLGRQARTMFTDYYFHDFFRLEDAFDYFTENEATGYKMWFMSYPIFIDEGQVFVIRKIRRDGTIGYHFHRSDGARYLGSSATSEFIIDQMPNWTVIDDLSYNQRFAFDTQYRVNLRDFNMRRQYTSENFYFISNDERSEWLPEMAEHLELELVRLLDILDVELLNRRIIVVYWDRHDFNIHNAAMQRRLGGTTVWGVAGYARSDMTLFSIARTPGRGVLNDNDRGVLTHELVHLLQGRIPRMRWTPAWVIEGTATYLDGFHYDLSGFRTLRLRPPTLDQIEDYDFFWRVGNILQNYIWAATIIDFVHSNFGFEYVFELHRSTNIEEVFGISREEFETKWHDWLIDRLA